MVEVHAQDTTSKTRVEALAAYRGEVEHMGGLIRLLAFAIGKKLGQKAGLETFGQVARMTLKEKMRDLPTDAGLSASYLESILKESRSVEGLQRLLAYLKSARNTLPEEETKRLIAAVARKLNGLLRAKMNFIDVVDAFHWLL